MTDIFLNSLWMVAAITVFIMAFAGLLAYQTIAEEVDNVWKFLAVYGLLMSIAAVAAPVGVYNGIKMVRGVMAL